MKCFLPVLQPAAHIISALLQAKIVLKVTHLKDCYFFFQFYNYSAACPVAALQKNNKLSTKTQVISSSFTTATPIISALLQAKLVFEMTHLKYGMFSDR